MTPNTPVNTYCLPNVSAVVTPYTSSVFMSATTSATGATYVAFSSQACTIIDIDNRTTVQIEVQKDGAGVAVLIPVGTVRSFSGITNANQLAIRRVDQSNTQVSVTAEAITV